MRWKVTSCTSASPRWANHHVPHAAPAIDAMKSSASSTGETPRFGLCAGMAVVRGRTAEVALVRARLGELWRGDADVAACDTPVAECGNGVAECVRGEVKVARVSRLK